MIQALETLSNAPSSCKVMILSDAIPNRNGVGTYYHDLMEHLKDQLGHVEMIPARANCIFKKNRVWIPLPGDASQHLYLPNVIPILKQVQEVQPDVIIAPTLGPFALMARWISMYTKTPLVFGYHTSLDKLASLYWDGHFGKLTNWYLKRASRVMFRYADAVVVNTDDMLEEARRMGAQDIQVMGTTIAQPMMTTPVIPYGGEVKNILFAGRLAKEKRAHRLAEAAHVHPGMTFRFAGEGPMRKEIERIAEGCENVEMLGWLERTELLKEIDRADVVVLPSRHESFGSIALEVMARGRLMMVSDQCGILRWPHLARGLCVIPEGDSVADALQELLSTSPEERKRIARVAYQATHDMNDQTLEEWRDVLETVGQKDV